MVLHNRQEYLGKMLLILKAGTKFSGPNGVDKTVKIDKQLNDVTKNLKNDRILIPE